MSCPSNLELTTSITAFSHPLVPGVYSNNENCSWIVPGVSTVFTSLTFTFSTEQCCDYIRIYQPAPTGWQLLRALSGVGSAQVIASEAAAPLAVVFTSDGSIVSTGFNASIARITDLPTTCPSGQILPLSQTQIRYPTENVGYPSNQRCVWVVPGVSGLYTLVTLTAVLYSPADVVYVYNGGSTSAPLLGAYSSASHLNVTSTYTGGFLTIMSSPPTPHQL
jgi:hypothetical protein